MLLEILALSVEHSVHHWLYRLGGIGLIAIGLADNSVIPLPGSMDAFTILLSSGHKDYWWYYAIMATLGAVLGGYVTYVLARKGGKEALEKRIGKKRAEKVYKKFDEGAFFTVLIGSILPPPFPIVPVLLAAGALQYPRKHFLTALAIGRGARFFLDAWLGQHY
ncbi:MAG TPA: VTT domain-containing protein, partial [Terriglobales bacterium]|nr:VTT domain-containing protein [Terriglobales bacterium]